MSLRPRNPWCGEPNCYDFLAPGRCSPCFSRPGCSRKSADAPRCSTVAGRAPSPPSRSATSKTGSPDDSSPPRTTRAPPPGAPAAGGTPAPSRPRDPDARHRARRARGGPAGRGADRSQAATYPGRRGARLPLRGPPAARGGAGTARRGRRRRGADHLHRGAAQRGRLLQPVPRDRGRVLRDVGPGVRLPGRLLDGGHVARAGAGHRVGDLRRRPDLDLHDARRRDLVRR